MLCVYVDLSPSAVLGESLRPTGLTSTSETLRRFCSVVSIVFRSGSNCMRLIRAGSWHLPWFLTFFAGVLMRFDFVFVNGLCTNSCLYLHWYWYLLIIITSLFAVVLLTIQKRKLVVPAWSAARIAGKLSLRLFSAPGLGRYWWKCWWYCFRTRKSASSFRI